MNAKGKAIDPLPCLLVDTREQAPLVFTHLQSAPAALQSGDYSVRGLEDVFAVERKSMNDLVGSMKSGRKRFMRKLHRLRGFTFARLLVVGTEKELAAMVARGRVSLDMVKHSLLSIEQRYGVPVERVDTPEEAALRVEEWAFTAWRDAAAKVGLRLPFPEWVQGDALRLNRPASISEVLTLGGYDHLLR